ncbi:MAG: hypothetical protein QM682_13815 [Paracoccus sp. (in: a-proteobacteria)]|uniref:hypothetical protein n=1 Tax=Paracoccus sp. TaxID=267 RepID=UPI0039E51FA5
MKTPVAIAWEPNRPPKIERADLDGQKDGPKDDEVLTHDRIDIAFGLLHAGGIVH